MFNIHTLTLINFRSYKGTHRFEFPSAIGLYYLTGKNLLEPALGANGAGKSTFLDAITWVLYGHTTRGLKANEVLSWHGSSGAQVIIELSVGSQRHIIKRSQKPNNLTIDDKPVDQKELETSIRLNYVGFTHSILSPQFGDPFFSMKASEKLTLFSDFMRLDYWLVKSDEASKLAKKQETALDNLRDDITRIEGQISVITDDIDDLKEKEASFETERNARVKEIEAEAIKVYKAHRKLKKSIEMCDSVRPELAVEVEHERAVLHAAEKSRDAVLDLILAESKRKVKSSDEIKRLKARISDFNSLKGETCPCCDQKVNEKHAGRIIDSLRDDLDDEESYLERSGTALEDLNVALVKEKGKCETAAATVQEIEDEIAKLDAKMAEKRVKLRTINSELDSIATELDKVKMGKNPFTAMVGAKVQKLEDLKHASSTHERDLSTLESDFAATSFWVKGFKRIRLFIIEQAFQTLEVEVNNCLAQLGMTEWQVTFDVERENKSGGITKGFVVLIKGPSNKEPVRWENWSGGETQRLQLAGDLGLANLILHQAGLRSEIEFFDEPSTHLSPEGMMDLADMLHDRAISEGKRIWIVDHASITNFGDFEGIIIARKDENGSSIACS